MKRHNFLKLLVLALLAILTLTLVACDNDNGSEITDAAFADRVELTIATWANATEAAEFDEIIDRLNASQDGYYLRQEMIPADYYTVLQTMIAGNQAPDLFWLAQEFIPAYATNGAIVDITTFTTEQSQLDMSDFLDGTLNTARYQGNLYGLPWIGQPFVVYYNADMFAAAGLERPSSDWTWDDLATAATAMTGNGTYGFGALYIPVGIFTWGYGGELVDVDGTVMLDSEASIRGLERFNNVINSEFTAPRNEIYSMGVEQAFVQEIIGMFIGGANDGVEHAVAAANAGFEVGMAQVPAGSEQQVTFNWTASTVISSQTDHLEAAEQALLDLTEAMFDWKVPTPIESRLGNIADINPYKEYAVDTILLAAQRSRGFNNMPQQAELGSAVWEELTSVVLTNNYGSGGFDVAELARVTAERMRAIID